MSTFLLETNATNVAKVISNSCTSEIVYIPYMTNDISLSCKCTYVHVFP